MSATVHWKPVRDSAKAACGRRLSDVCWSEESSDAECAKCQAAMISTPQSEDQRHD